jgi:hypothetical protein
VAWASVSATHSYRPSSGWLTGRGSASLVITARVTCPFRLINVYSFLIAADLCQFVRKPYLPAVHNWVLPTAICLATAAAALTEGGPVEGPVAAVFPPWWRGAEVFAAAAGAGRIIGPGAVPFVVVVAPEGARTAERLRAAGAILVIDPIVAGGCTPIRTPL